MMVGNQNVEKELHLKRMSGRAQGQLKGSLNKCLLLLGAPYDEVYKPNVSGTRHTVRSTIYDRYSKGDLRTWLEWLYGEYKKKYHPDRHLEDKEFYEWKFKEGQEAYLRAKGMLK
jgi:hypothetical protein